MWSYYISANPLLYEILHVIYLNVTFYLRPFESSLNDNIF